MNIKGMPGNTKEYLTFTGISMTTYLYETMNLIQFSMKRNGRPLAV